MIKDKHTYMLKFLKKHSTFFQDFIIFNNNPKLKFLFTNTFPVDGTVDQDLVTNFYYNYSYSQQIYLQSEVTTGGTISSVWFKYDGYTNVYGTLSIYLGHTSKTQFSSTSDWVDQLLFN